ncbi:hypothetical protein [Shewanella sp. CG12_big_fil_rev_8_21_14_0_65_47_15]|uniref:hypothetical protein n=1 Tax=Shewanella sp. CG12_big_fil_rev_8_21_14_0_65_47_15 TaxID=1975537 RepID=UPI000CB73FF8|nr:hypothetical protein [Shewanella sp. CG12_big_fil_rev_8_21_14_0_65_47_15]PIW60079.1 MAG: hypothetical protein COW15_14415 [Shewanella sp. CG12_big_fil_rev_8_21_14_0_65_47_15]
MLLKSLFCLHGRDSRPRFAAISVGVYVCISLAVAGFGANFLMYLLALLGLPLLALTSLRRLMDANKPKFLAALLVLPLPVYLALLIVGAPPFIAILGLVLAAGATFWGARLPSPTIVDYRFGYYGPALDSPTSQAIPRRRVEPVLTPKTAATAQTYSQTEPTGAATSAEVDLEALRQDELRFDELTRMTQNPADFVVQDAIIAAQADFRPANQSRVQQTHIEVVDVDLAQVDLQHANSRHAPLDPADLSDEPVWRFDPDDESHSINQAEDAEEMRRRRAEAKDSGSMTELFRGLIEFFSPYRRYLVLPRLPMPNRRYWRPAAIGLGGLMLVVLVWGLWPNSDEQAQAQVVSAVPVAPIASDRVTLEMPDGFSVALEGDVLIMRWLGEQGKAQNIWSLATAQGDKTCRALVFNNGTEYRPMTVDLKADSATEARFSPLDSAGIIVDLARRGSIGLCGYKFSLKGSQAILEQNRTFADYLAQ